jgi:hypothetical protein
VALKQAATQEFRTYQQQVVANCQALAARMKELGYSIVSGEGVGVGGEVGGEGCGVVLGGTVARVGGRHTNLRAAAAAVEGLPGAEGLLCVA